MSPCSCTASAVDSSNIWNRKEQYDEIRNMDKSHGGNQRPGTLWKPLKSRKSAAGPFWLGLTAAAAVAAIVLGVVLWPGGSPLVPTVQAVSQAEYPASAPYPDESSDAAGASYEAWYQDQAARREWSKQCNQTLGSFLSSTIPQFLAGQTEENRVYSPLSLYMALAMLAELTDGNSRQQVLDLLDVPDLETLRTRATALWQSHYVNDGATTCILASSLWLNQDVTFVQSTLDTLSKTYYASTYQGKMGSKGDQPGPAELDQRADRWASSGAGGGTGAECRNGSCPGHDGILPGQMGLRILPFRHRTRSLSRAVPGYHL